LLKQELDQKNNIIINLEKQSTNLELELKKKEELKNQSYDESVKELDNLKEKLKFKEKTLEIVEDKLQQSESKIKRLQNNIKPTYVQNYDNQKHGWDFGELAIVKFAKDKLGNK
jgi:predicted  nucleic acid-binding Zn-ribbon protein